MSTDPDDPEVIANTIIDCNGARLNTTRAFHFHSGEDRNTKVIGFTIKNGYINGGNGTAGIPYMLTPDPYDFEPTPPANFDPNRTPPRAERGGDFEGNGYGGAILCENGSSPTIENCVITNCTVTGAHGGDGADGEYDPQLLDIPGEWSYIAPTDPDGEVQTSNDGRFGGFGGAGIGNGYGGAIACLSRSCPTIINCTISDNTALGGMGGDGGDGGSTASGAASGGGSGGYAYGDGIGGGLYSDSQSCPTVIDCNFVNNIVTTGIPGQGGARGPGGDNDLAFAGSVGPIMTSGDDPFGFGFGDPSPGGIAGGAAYFDDNSDANFTDCTFSENQAFFVDDGDPFTGNVNIYTVGGALFSAMNNSVILENCEFTGNLAGAVYCSSGCTLDVNDCSFQENTEVLDGGAIYIGQRVNVNIRNSGFSCNSVYRDGGSIRSESNADFRQYGRRKRRRNRRVLRSV